MKGTPTEKPVFCFREIVFYYPYAYRLFQDGNWYEIVASTQSKQRFMTEALCHAKHPRSYNRTLGDHVRSSGWSMKGIRQLLLHSILQIPRFIILLHLGVYELCSTAGCFMQPLRACVFVCARVTITTDKLRRGV